MNQKKKLANYLMIIVKLYLKLNINHFMETEAFRTSLHDLNF